MSAVAILVHGAGSTPDTVRRLLGPAVPDGATALAIDARGGIEEVLDRLAAAWARAQERSAVVLVGGISLGAHAVALWGARLDDPPPLLLAMPAWSGRPGAVAGLTGAAAREIEDAGVPSVLARLRADPATSGDWVLDELDRAWSSYDAGALARTLRAAAASPGPEPSDLARIAGPVAVVALADDPLHPEEVARAWAAAIPRSRLAVVARHEPSRDRGALGRAGRAALDRLSGSR